MKLNFAWQLHSRPSLGINGFCFSRHRHPKPPAPDGPKLNVRFFINKSPRKKAQGIIEFVVLFGAVLFFFMTFFLVIQVQTSQKNLEKQTVIAQNIVLSVQDEIALASEASDGYSREFTIPNTIIGKEFEIGIDANWVYIEADKIGIAYPVLNVTGDVQKGINLIKKEDGEVLLN